MSHNGPSAGESKSDVNYFRGYFRGTSADYSPHLLQPWGSRVGLFPPLLREKEEGEEEEGEKEEEEESPFTEVR